MAQKRSAGDLLHFIAFDLRAEIDDGAGNTVGTWQERFKVRASYLHLRGGESVMAGRLQGQHSQIIVVRASPATREVTTDWRIRDFRTRQTFNIRDITPSADRQWLDFLCQSGVADG
ncbi:phage head closure protein [Rhizobium rhizogenes]|uniref:phage head closure protein n=1 Tax=Rhizobium rhizogenes TaxID=359 RepID=UPI003ECFB50D